LKNTFLQLSKVEEQADGTCIVRGRATAEQPDLANEIFDWATGRPEVEKWRDAALLRSAGKSLGNIRSMHGKIAAGIATAISFDDTNRSMELESHVIDLAEAAKCISGTYTGYSIAGDYLKRWADPVIKGAMRYTPSIAEISLVDSPCLASATFNYVKCDGASELRKFAPAKAVTALAKAKNIDAAAAEALVKKLALRKGMWDVGTLASIMAQIAYMEESLTYEADREGDESKIPAQLRVALVGLKQIFLDLAAEEVTELVGEPAEAAKAAAAQLQKEVASMVTRLNKAIELAGASTDPEMKKMETHLKEIGKHVDKIAKAHSDMSDSITALQGEGDAKPEAKKDEKEEAEKAAATGTLNKANDMRFAAIETSMAENKAAMAKSNEVLALIAGRLVPTPVAAVAVAKVADAPGAAEPAAITDPTEAIKAAHAAGMTRRIA
jgi:hypothetical protein